MGSNNGCKRVSPSTAFNGLWPYSKSLTPQPHYAV